MKTMSKNILMLCSVTLMTATPAFAAKKAGIGFSFGTAFHQHQKANFKQASANQFRINFLGDEGSSFFVHNEQSAFNVEQGDASTAVTSQVQGMGVKFDLAQNVDLDIMLGGATVIIPAAASASGGTDAIAAINSTDSIADIGVKWNQQSGKLNLAVGAVMRQHKMSNNLRLTSSAGAVTTVNDLSSTNMTLEINYNF